MSTYQPPGLMSSGSPADDCWAISDWYRDRGDLTRAQDWADAAQRAEEFEDNNEWSAQRLAELATKPYLTQRALAMFNGSVELARAWIGADPKRERRVLFEISIRKCQGRQTTAKYEAMQHAVALWVAEETAERENVQTAEDRMMLGAAYLEAMDAGAI